MAVQTVSPPPATTGVRTRELPALLPYAAGLAAGIALERYFAIAIVPILAVMAVLCGALTLRAVRLRCGVVSAFLLAGCCGALLHHRAFRTVSADDIVNFTAPDQRLARVTGTIIDRPRTTSGGYAPFEPWLFQQSRTSCLVQVDAVESPDGFVPASGLLGVRVKEAALHLQSGARVEAFGWLYRPSPPRNPGGFDWALFQSRRGVRANISCPRAECVRVLAEPQAQPWWSVGRLRSAVRRLLLDDRLERGGPEVSVLDAMVLGRRAGVDRRVERAFADTGCAHYLAVSGVHVGMLAFAIWLPARLFGISKRRTVWLVILVIIAYELLVDPRPPIMRAAVMAATYGLAVTLRRPRATVSAVCVAAIVLLVADPLSLFDVGFQLSFLTVLGILLLTPVIADGMVIAGRRVRALALREKPVSADIERISAMHAPHKRLRRAVKGLMVALAVALAAWASSLPIVVGAFGRVTPIGWLASWFAFPLVFVVMLLGFMRIAIGALLPPLGVIVDAPLGIAVDALLHLLEWFAQLPHASIAAPPLPWWLIALYYAALLAVAAWGRGWLRRRYVVTCALPLLIATVLWWTMSAHANGVRVTQLAVGRGASTVIELSDGSVWLYDAGSSGNYDPGEGVIVPYLHHRGIRRVDGIMISHANLDHFGGVPAILRAIRSGPVYVSHLFAETCVEDSPCSVLRDELARADQPVRTLQPGEPLVLEGDVRLEVLWPPADPPAGLDVNDTSLVVRLIVGKPSMLFCGDIGAAPQQWLIDNADISADVLVLPHHGAVVATTQAFIARVGAGAIVRSSFTAMDESDELRSIIGDVPTYDTADVGAVEVVLDGESVRISGFAASPANASTPALLNTAREP